MCMAVPAGMLAPCGDSETRYSLAQRQSSVEPIIPLGYNGASQIATMWLGAVLYARHVNYHVLGMYQTGG